MLFSTPEPCIKNYADQTENVVDGYMIFVKKVRSSERLVMKIVEN
jgi:hypothetical protein